MVKVTRVFVSKSPGINLLGTEAMQAWQSIENILSVLATVCTNNYCQKLSKCNTREHLIILI